MPKLLGVQSLRADEAEPELAFRVEVTDGAGGAEEILCACATAGIAYAAYYAAMREHFGRRVRLVRGAHTIAQS